MRELSGTIDDLAPDHGESRGDVGDLGLRTREIVDLRDGQVAELPVRDSTLLAFFIGEPRNVLGPHPQGGLAVEAVALWIEPQAADRLAGYEPRQRDPRVVGRDASGVGAGRDVEALREHPREGGRRRRRDGAVPLDEVL